MRENAKHFQRPQGCIRFWTFKDFEEFIALSFRRNIWQQMRGLLHGFACFELDLEPKCRGLTYRSQNPHRVILQ